MRTPAFGSPRLFLMGALAISALAACGSDNGASPSQPQQAAALATDLRFKGVGTTPAVLPFLTSAISNAMVNVQGDAVGTPLELSPCGSALSGFPNCSWAYAVFDPTDTFTVSTVYDGAGQLSAIAGDLAALQLGKLTPTAGLTSVNASSVITSLVVDEPSGAYGFSGIHRSDIADFALTSEFVLPSGLQTAATAAGVRGRVITALGYDGANVAVISYKWAHDTASSFESKVATVPFDGVATAARGLAAEGYVITALGGDPTRGFMLVGTRVAGSATPRLLQVATDSASPQIRPVSDLAIGGYAIVGGIFGGHTGDTHLFNLYIGEK